MKHALLTYTLFLFILNIHPSFGQNGLSLNGYLQSDLHAGVRDSIMYRGHELRLDLQAEAKPADRCRFYAEAWLRSLDQPPAHRMSDLINQRMDLDLREAYLDLYGIPFAQCDLRLGRQRIAWGTADKLNPTDNLNPPDLEDIWDFDRHLGSDAVKLSLYPGSYAITGVIIPFYEPAVLPHGDWASIFTPDIRLPAGLTLKDFSDTLLMPANDPAASSIVGVKLARTVLGYDLSLSYLYGRDHLPLPRRLVLSPADTLGGVNVRSELVFPRRHVFGADLAGSIRGLGVWLETAVFLPEQEAVLTTDLTALGLGKADSVVLPKKPYVKYVLGFDHTFSGGIYANLQFLHGFIHERGTDNLENYLLAGLEWKLYDERLKIMPANGGIEIKGWADPSDNYAIIYAPEISYQPVDNAELTAGAHWIGSHGTTAFGRGRDLSEIFLQLRYSF